MSKRKNEENKDGACPKNSLTYALIQYRDNPENMHKYYSYQKLDRKSKQAGITSLKSYILKNHSSIIRAAIFENDHEKATMESKIEQVIESRHIVRN